MKVLVATEKPFSKVAVDGIQKIVEGAGYTFAKLEKYSSPAELLAAVADADALIVRSDKVTKEVVDAAKNLKIVVRAGAGYDNLDLAACSERGIVAMNTPGQNSNAVAELALCMMVYISRNQFTPGTGSELKGKTLGIQAYGNVGRLVAALAKGFGMKIMAFDPFVPAEKMVAEGAGAASVAAVMFNKVPVKGKKTACIVSGGNIDVTILNRVINRGLTKSGRICTLCIELDDKPGQLVQVSTVIAELGANIISVSHERNADSEAVNACLLRLTAETKNHEHVAEIKRQLMEKGFKIIE